MTLAVAEHQSNEEIDDLPPQLSGTRSSDWGPAPDHDFPEEAVQVIMRGRGTPVEELIDEDDIDWDDDED